MQYNQENSIIDELHETIEIIAWLALIIDALMGIIWFVVLMYNWLVG